jgi:hypothetical protein
MGDVLKVAMLPMSATSADVIVGLWTRLRAESKRDGMSRMSVRSYWPPKLSRGTS